MEIEEMRRESAERMEQMARMLKEKLGRIKHKVAVYSAKGGVGKTTVAVNLAVTLAKQGYKVGFLDADVDCPNAHMFFGINSKTKIERNMLQPIEKHGVRVVSTSMLTDRDDEAIIWRGPMLTKAIRDMLFMTNWGDLDYLIVDLPPGTSDAPLTVMQLLDLSGFIAVTTPQDASINDLRRSINMVRRMGSHAIGVVDNMCGPVFGRTDENVVKEMGTSIIAHIPLEKAVAEAGNKGKPAVLQSREIEQEFLKIVKAIGA